MSKIAILDTSFITNWLNPKKNKEEVEKFRNFEDSVKKKKIIIAFPTPVISELLMGPVKSVSDDILGKNIKKLPFDYKASVECANIFGKQKGEAKVKIKFDCQIIAIAKANNITTIYSDDEQLKKRAENQNINVITSKELPLSIQTSLF